MVVLPGHLQELGIVPYASCVEPLPVVAQEEGQYTVPVVDRDLVVRHAIVGLVVAVVAVAAVADTGRDEDNYKTVAWQVVLYSFRKVLRAEELLS